MSPRAVAGGLVLTACLSLALGLLVVAAQYVQINLGDATATGATRLNQYITIAGAIQSATLFTVLAMVGIDDWLSGHALSPLFGPLIATKAVLTSLLILLAVTAFDLLLHGLQPQWRFMFDSDVRLLISALYGALVCTLSWQVAVILRGRGIGWRTMTAALATTAAIASVIVWLIVTFAR